MAPIKLAAVLLPPYFVFSGAVSAVLCFGKINRTFRLQFNQGKSFIPKEITVNYFKTFILRIPVFPFMALACVVWQVFVNHSIEKTDWLSIVGVFIFASILYALLAKLLWQLIQLAVLVLPKRCTNWIVNLFEWLYRITRIEKNGVA